MPHGKDDFVGFDQLSKDHDYVYYWVPEDRVPEAVAALNKMLTTPAPSGGVSTRTMFTRSD